MFLGLEGIGRLVTLSSRKNNHLTLWCRFLHFDSYTTSRCHHVAFTLGTTETGIQKDGDTLSRQGTQLLVKTIQGIGRLHVAADAVDRQQIGILVGLVRDAVTSIVQNDFALSALCLHRFLQPSHSTTDSVQARIGYEADMVFRNAQCLLHIVLEDLGIVFCKRYFRLILVQFIANDDSISACVLYTVSRYVFVHIRHSTFRWQGWQLLLHRSRFLLGLCQ